MADPGYVVRVVIWRADLARWEGEAMPGQPFLSFPTKVEMEDLLDWLEAGRRQDKEPAGPGKPSDRVSR